MSKRRTEENGRRGESRSGRTIGQRLLLGLGVLVTTFAVLVVGVAGWAAWRYMSIERANVELDAPLGGPRNHLIVGSDSRSGGDPDGGDAEDRPPLADTIMILRIDPSHEDAKVLSLPRDLWVTKPDGEEGRINAAYASGPQGLIDTIRSELDIPIHHYVEVDFQAFQEVVGAVDGVPMWFDVPVRDLNSGLDVPEAGCIVLDPRQALGFARSRHLQYLDADTGRYRYDGTADLGRISRQQLFIRKVIERATSKASGNPIMIERVASGVVDHITLDQTLGLSDLTSLAERFRSFDADRLITLTVPVIPRTTSGGAQVVDLDEEGAEPVLAEFRDPVPAPPTQPTGITPDAVANSAVRVAVYNSSGVAGLADATAGRLEAVGFVVIAVGNGSDVGRPSEQHTSVRHAPGLEAEAAAVATHLGVTETTADADTAPGTVAVFLAGDDTTGRAEAAPTSTAPVAATPAATTTTIASSDPIGIVPGDAPAGSTCG